MNGKWTYDIECLPNIFMVIFKKRHSDEVKRFLIHGETNHLAELLKFIRGQTLISFNGFHYDDIILNYLIDKEDRLSSMTVSAINHTLYTLSGMVINYDNQSPKSKKEIRRLKYMTHFQGIDVMRIANIQKSLKLTATNLKWHKIQDLPIAYDQDVPPHMIGEMWSYNMNDVLITEAIYDTLRNPKDDKIGLRYDLTEQYGVNVINESDSGIFNKLFDKLYSDATGQPVEAFKDKRTKRGIIPLTDVVFDNVSFKTPELQEFLEDIKKLTVDCSQDKLELGIPELSFRGITIQFGAGGIHSVDSGAVYRSTVDYDIIDADVASMYPATIINYGLYPAHLSESFIRIYRGIRDRRIVAKREGRVAEEKGLKIVVNTAYGKMNSKFHWMYDPLAALRVTINGQLFLLMLIEELMLAGLEVISANTDGVTTIVPHQLKETYDSICKAWEQVTLYELEYANYKTYFRRDVNNYTAELTNGKTKYKGKFHPELYKDLTKGYSMPIVPLALNNYYLYGTPVSDTIRKHTDIFDFCSSNKVGSTFSRLEYHTDFGVSELQRSIRYYVSTNGGYLFKVKPVEEHEVAGNGYDIPNKIVPAHDALHALVADTKVNVFNDYYETDDYNIDYSFYEEEVNKLICAIENRKYISPGELEGRIAKLEESVRKNQLKYDTFIAKQSKSKAVESTLITLNKQKEQLETLLCLRQR